MMRTTLLVPCPDSPDNTFSIYTDLEGYPMASYYIYHNYQVLKYQFLGAGVWLSDRAYAQHASTLDSNHNTKMRHQILTLESSNVTLEGNMTFSMCLNLGS